MLSPTEKGSGCLHEGCGKSVDLVEGKGVVEGLREGQHFLGSTKVSVVARLDG